MARGGGSKWGCSYKKTTLIVCSVNIVVALIALRSIYGFLYVYPGDDFSDGVKYTTDQIRRMEESIRIRRENEPRRLIQLMKELKEEEVFREQAAVELPPEVKRRITDEIIQRLRSVSAGANVSLQREALESWRKEKLQEVKHLSVQSELLNSTILQTEAGMLARALQSDWAALSEDIGLWMPSPIINHEHDDKPDGLEEEEEVLPGRPPPPECHAELHTDYDGAAVRWGLTYHKESAADCCQACLDHAKNAKPGEKRCNIWVYCPSEAGCYSPDIYEHKNQECWLKYSETPRLNFKDRYPEAYRNSHPNAPVVVPWVSGVTSS